MRTNERKTMATTLRKHKRKGLFRDDKGQLWVLIHLDDSKEDLLEWGEDISYKFYCPEYSLITSGDCDFLSVDHTKEMEQINDEDYACIEFAHDCTDYAYVNEKVVKENIMEMFKCVDSYEDLAIFISHYTDLISKI